MSAGIDTKYDRIYSNEGTEWHRMAIQKQVITTEDIEGILFPIIESPAYMMVDERLIQLPNNKILGAD